MKNKLRMHISVILLIILLSTGFIIKNAFGFKSIDNQEYEETTVESYYILKDDNGRLALYYSEKSLPLETYDIFTSSLPERDREKILKGIRADSTEELIKLLENYLG